MPDRIVIEGVPPFDGEYPLELEDAELTTLEWRWIKQLAGYLPLNVTEGLTGGDPDLIVALAVVALARAGKIAKSQALLTGEQLADVPFDFARIRLELGEPEAGDADPPAEAAEASFSSTSSGIDSEPPSASPANGLAITGSPDSARSAAFERLTSPT